LAVQQTNVLRKNLARLTLLLPGYFALTITTQSLPAIAQAETWLPPNSKTELSTPPPEFLSSGTELSGKILLGRLLFNSPTLLGEKAIRIGLSCNSCHPSGHVNTSFYISGLSNSPGTIDLTNRFWKAGQEDNIFNPIPIPSLRGVSKTAPYGMTLNVPSLDAFTSHVMTDEFGAPFPSKGVLDALVSYMNQLETKQSVDKYIHVGTPRIPDLLDLLADPLKRQDVSEFGLRADLIKEEFGRQASDQNRPKLTIAALSISKIASKMAKDPIITNRAFIKLRELFSKK